MTNPHPPRQNRQPDSAQDSPQEPAGHLQHIENPVVTWLTARGFGPVHLKVLICTVLTAAFTLPAGLGPLAHGRDIGWFGVFALFSAWNFFGLVYLVHGIIPNGWTRFSGLKAFFGLQLRLFLTAILVYAALVWWNVPVAALVGGLSTSLIWLLLLGIKG